MPLPFLRKIKAIRRRLQWIEFCRKFLKTTAWLAVILLVVLLITRLIVSPYTPERAAIWLGGASVAWLLLWTWIRRVRLFEAALRADETLGLKERLSSAILLRQPRDEAEVAVIEDATRCAEAIRPAKHFPSNLKKELRWAIFPLGTLALAWWLMPQFDLLATREEKKGEVKSLKAEAKKEAAKELEELAKEVANTGELKKSELAKQAEREMNQLAKELKDMKIGSEEAMAKIAKTAEKVAERRGELEKKLEKSGNMQGLGEGKMTRDISKALQNNNFKKASDAMQELQKKLQSGQLSAEEKASLQKELQAMAEKMGKDCKMGEAMSKAAKSLSENKTSEAMADMEMASSEMMSNQEMMNEMQALEQLQDDIEARNRAMSAKPGTCEKCGKPAGEGEKLCSSCQKAGEWKPGDSRKRGGGSGASGLGEGSIRPKEEGDVAFEKKKVKGDLQAGKIVAKMKIPGDQNVGEVKTAYEDLRLQYEQKAEDSIQTELLPLEHKARIREYFDAIKESKEETPSSAKQPSEAPVQGAAK